MSFVTAFMLSQKSFELLSLKQVCITNAAESMETFDIFSDSGPLVNSK